MTDELLGKKTVRFTANESPEKVDAQTRRFKLSDSSVALDGHTLATAGWDLSRAKENLPVLWAHDSENVESVLGQWQNVHVQGDDLVGDAAFMPRELNPTAGMVLDMIDGGWLRMCSVGFVPTDGKPAKGRGQGSYDFTAQTLLEASICPVGSLATALVSARDAGINIGPAREWAKRILEIDMTDLTLPAANPAPAPRVMPKIGKRGLGHVAWLASILLEIGYLEECVEWEAAIEEDGSAVPEKLAEAMKALGSVLIDMTVEEVSELLAEEGEDDLPLAVMAMSANSEARKAIVDALRDAANGKTVTITTSRSIGLIRSGRVLSADNERCLRDAHQHIRDAAEMVMSVVGKTEPADDSEEETRAAEARARRERIAKAAQAGAI